MSGNDAKEHGDDRRTDERHFACFPAHIQRPGGLTRMALIRDLSVAGALLLTRERLEVGDTVALNLYLTEDMDRVRLASARVVRVEKREGVRAEVWHYSTAVHFDAPLTDCEAEIAEIERRQTALGVPRD